jgi:hypothetical protein
VLGAGNWIGGKRGSLLVLSATRRSIL